MNTYREGISTDPFPQVTPDEPPAADERSIRPAVAILPEGWRRISTGQRETRLYEIRASGGGNHWFATMCLNGKALGRRFASELHARAWLAAAIEPHTTTVCFDSEERNGALRAATLFRGGCP